jgi:hypothetical protein
MTTVKSANDQAEYPARWFDPLILGSCARYQMVILDKLFERNLIRPSHTKAITFPSYGLQTHESSKKFSRGGKKVFPEEWLGT